jgi:hypothetical protein
MPNPGFFSCARFYFERGISSSPVPYLDFFKLAFQSMNILKIAIASLLFLSNNGCVFHRENILEDAEYRVQGRTKAEILACAGTPSSTRKREGNEYLIYTNGLPSSEPGSCKVTFTLQDGHVSKFEFSGDLTGMKASANTCYQVVRGCW